MRSHGLFSIRHAALLVLLLSASNARAIDGSPSPSFNGSYTVSWSTTLGYSWEDIYPCYPEHWYSLQENGVDVAWSGYSLPVSGKPPGTYEYRVYYRTSVCGSPYDEYVVEGPVYVTVVDPPEFTISDPIASEGNALAFVITRNGASPFTHAVHYYTGDGSATLADGDYASAASSLSFPPSAGTADTQTVYVTTLDEAPSKVENNQTMAVYLYDGGYLYGATISDSTGVGTITNDDTVTFTINDPPAIVEGTASNNVVGFTVTMSGLTELSHSVNYATANNSATGGSDFTTIGTTTLNFSSSQTTQPVNVTTLADSGSEQHETFFVNLSNPVGASVIGDNSGTGTINNDDAPGATSSLNGPLGITGATTSATLTWTAPSGYVSHHEVERTLDGVVTTANSGSPAASYNATGLTTDGSYRFRVRACSSAGNFCGAWSNPRDVVRSNADPATGVPALTTGSSDAGPSTGLTTDFNGIVAGQAGVAPSGAATYTIPIAIPPGTRGMQPSLALVYGSHAGTGVVGRGWVLAGASGAVTRCGKTLVQDAVIHAVNYTANDRFCLDGQRLVMTTAGAYGGDGMRYRTEVDSFRDVVSNGGTASSPNSFTVRTPHGQTLSYGGTPASNFQASALNIGEIAAWLLRRVEDKYGNFYEITYIEDETNGDYRTSRIDYTGHSQTPITAPYASVEFFYQALTNPIKHYQAGSVVSVQQRLTKIAVKSGATPVREYVLGYDAGETALPSAMSRLTSIKECAPTEASTVCTAPTTFDWINDAGGLGPLQAVTPPSGGSVPEFPDLNGDGKADMVSLHANQHAVFLGTETGLQPSHQMWSIPPAGSGYTLFKFTDVDGDGDSDYIRLNPAVQQQHVFKSTGSGYAASQTWAAGSPILSGYAFVELNGDGRTDFVTWQNSDPDETIYYYVSFGGSTNYANYLWTGPKLDNGTPGWQPETFSFHDANGDSRADLVLVKGATHRIYLNNGAGFDPYFEATTQAPMPGAIWADLNGDSLLDYNDGTTVAIWTGREYVSGWGLAYAGGWGPRDMNGDGLTDQVDGGSIHFSTGNTFATSPAWSGFTTGGNLYVQFPDFDGDGKPDLKLGSATVTYRLSQSTPAHLMERVTDGLGIQTTFTYKPLSDSAIHTKLSGATYPTTDIANAVHVVTQISQPDGNGGTFDTAYKYKGFRLDKQGRGSLGFSEVTTENLDRKVKTVTTYSQSFPYIGLPTSIDVTITDKLDNGTNVAQLISDLNRTYVTRNGVAVTSGPPIKFPCIDTDTTLEYDVESGALLRTVFADNTPTGGAPCDDFGNRGEPGTPDGYGTPLTNRLTVTDHVANPDVVYRGDTVSYYLNDTTNWLLGLVTRQVAKPFVDGIGDPTKDRTAAITYVAGKGVVFNIIREPEGSAPIKLTTEFDYDAFGNRKKETITPSDAGPVPSVPAVRIERVDFDSAGRFPTVLTNAENHVTNMTFDARFGAMATMDGPNATNAGFNDLITRTYDAFGRMKDERQPDGSYRVVYYKAVAAGASGSPGSNAKIMVETSAQNTTWGTTPTARLTPVRTFLDGLGRELRTRSRAFDTTNFVHIDTTYDSRGRVYQASEPYFEGQTPTWNTPAYDVLNRTVGVTAADATQSTTTDYNAFTVTTTDAGNRQNRLIADALGRTVRTENRDTWAGILATTEYLYDKAGNVETVRKLKANGSVVANTVITNGYDRLGRRTTTIDPEYGIVGGTTGDGLIKFEYDSMGDLRRQQTPRLRQQSVSLYTELDYDRLGRLRTQRDPANDLVQTVTSTFTFDEVPASPDDCRAGVGQLTTAAISGGSEPGLTTTYCYSPAQFGRLALEKRTTGGVTYQTNFTYDVLGRLQQVKYPATTTWPSASRYAVNYSYTPRGHLERIQEAQGSATVLYQTTGANARGQIERAYLGDGSRTTRKFVKDTERLAFTNAAIGASQQVQNFVYGYDTVGNISGRADLINSVSETFGYDALDRLKNSTVTNAGGPHAVGFAYDDPGDNLGNMLHKSDLSTLPSASMSFSTTARPHALTALNTGSGTRTFTYDANGRMTAGQVASTARTLTYTSYDLLASATIGTTSRTFNYGADRQRYQQVSMSGGTTRTYTYIGAHYVKEAQSGSATEHKLYIMANGEPVAYVSDDGTPETRYFHKDHLGSITTIITNQNFAGREKLSYDAWGKRRHGTDWWSAPTAATEERGYTGHEHLDNVNLIHMNGRAYDPQLGRFTSPDPFVPAPLYSQSYNRYAYVYNNPLKHTDPSGFSPLDECLGRFSNCMRVPWNPSPWDAPVIPDDGFDFASPEDWAYYFQQQALQEAELQRAYIATYIAEMNYTLSMEHPAAKTDQEGAKPQPTLGGALWNIGSGIVLGAAGFVPYLGDALDVYDVARPSATVTDRAIAGGSLALNAWTLGLAPNAGPIVKGGRRIGSGASDLWAVSKGWRDEATSAAKSGWDRVKRWAGGCGCFVAGTLVATAVGLTPIEAIEVGDEVWARDEQTGELALKPVTALIRPPERVIWEITLEIDEGTGVSYAEFEATDDHPWGALDGTWFRTDELKPGTDIQRAHGVPARVVSVVQTERTEQTYNLEVADFHTYFVGEAGVWVHNAKACNPESIADANRAESRAQGIPDSYLGPSGLPKRHTVEHSTRKEAREAAESEVPPGGRARNDANPTDPRQGPHFQSEDARGNNVRPVVHHEYPE